MIESAAPLAISEQLEAFAVALAIGLLIGLERERVPSSRAGVRTFGLVGLLGALLGYIGQQLGSVLPLVVGLVIVGATIISAYLMHPDPSDPGTTSVAALVICYCLGALVWFGQPHLAVMLGIAVTALLYFKTELRGLAARLTGRDWISILQFAVLSLVILPILPDEDFGPYGALNPHQVWLMVVLISGVSLAGYAALQVVGTRHGAALVGVLGGLASSTATTLVYARNARATPAMAGMATLVIVLANLVMLVRVAGIAAVVAPQVVAKLSLAASPALVLGLVAVLVLWRRIGEGGEVVLPAAGNPAELRAAVGFGLLYAAVLFATALLSDYAGNRGLYAVALVSGLTDVDAISLSSMRLLNLGKLGLDPTVLAIGLAMLANLVFKTGLALAIGGASIGKGVMAGMGATGLGLIAGLAIVMS
jgi:uncharacterized membrane protein (DUF4010 family)